MAPGSPASGGIQDAIGTRALTNEDAAPVCSNGSELEGLELLFSSTIWLRESVLHATSSDPAIPARVTSQVSLQVLPSNIAGGGRGVFVKNDVTAGGLVFNIKQPLLSIVQQPPALSFICDNCLVGCANIYYTGLVKNIDFKKCAHCEYVYYCNKKCQKAAWKHHHKIECQVLKGMAAEQELKGSVNLNAIRATVRLLRLHETGGLPDADINEILSLPNYRAIATKSHPEVEIAVAKFAIYARKFTKTTVGIEKIKDLCYLMLINPMRILSPSIKGSRSYDPKINMSYARAFTRIGTVLDPFPALLKHSCVPNVIIWYDGPELRVIALKDLTAGDELTVSYLPMVPDYDNHRHKLTKQFGIDCACELCASDGPLELPEGVLKSEALKIQSLNAAPSDAYIKIKNGIDNILQAGFGHGTFPLWNLHSLLMETHLLNGRTSECLRVALTIRYLVEPTQIPPAPLHDRITTLYMILSLLNIPVSGSTRMQELPDLVKNIIPFIFVHLRAMLVSYTAKCFGADSSVAKFERDYFRNLVETLEKVAEKQGHKFEKESLRKSQKAREVFVKEMNELLEWAGISKRTGAELLEDCVSVHGPGI